VDQVTVNLRVVDMRTGQILNSVSTTKTVYSRALDAGVFQFVAFKKLLEAEIGYSRNEPVQLCVKEAIEAGVIHLVAQGIRDKQWLPKDEKEIDSPLLQEYLIESYMQ
jgi:curli production assembly/transport component CsgG